MAVRVTQEILEVLIEPAAGQARLTQAVVEVLAQDISGLTLACDGVARVLWVTDDIPDVLHWIGAGASTGIWKARSDYWHADGRTNVIWGIEPEAEAFTGTWNADGLSTGRWDLPFGVGGNCLSGSGDADVEVAGPGLSRNYSF
jgi:hypothetical protein